MRETEKMKGKVIFTNHVKDLYHQIEKLKESLNQVMAANEKTTSALVMVKNFSINLASRIIDLEKLQAKTEQYNRRNYVEISGISSEITDEDLENNVIDICKNSNVIINPTDITVCHWGVTALLVINV